MYSLNRRFVSECLGTLVLLLAVIGSGIMASRLSGDNIAVALLAVTLSTAFVLYILITIFAPISGGHFNPAVTLMFAHRGKMPWREVPIYMVGQFCGGAAGALIAHYLFSEPLVSGFEQARTGAPIWVSEFIATFGLLAVIWACSKFRPDAIAAIVACYIGSAFWFTSSTCFANPAVTLARGLTGSFTGIRLVDVPMFVLAQTLGATAGTYVMVWLLAGSNEENTAKAAVE